MWLRLHQYFNLSDINLLKNKNYYVRYKFTRSNSDSIRLKLYLQIE